MSTTANQSPARRAWEAARKSYLNAGRVKPRDGKPVTATLPRLTDTAGYVEVLRRDTAWGDRFLHPAMDDDLPLTDMMTVDAVRVSGHFSYGYTIHGCILEGSVTEWGVNGLGEPFIQITSDAPSAPVSTIEWKQVRSAEWVFYQKEAASK